MKLSIQRETILKPLQSVIGVVERRQTLPILANLLFTVTTEGIEITATDLEVELVAILRLPTETTGEFTVPARKLVDIVKTLPEETELNLSTKQEKAQLVAGRSRFTLSTLPANEYPSLEKFEVEQEVEVPQQALKQLIERTQFAMAQQDVRYYLNGLMLEFSPGILRGVATDGHRLALGEVKVEADIKKNLQVILPRKGVQELVRLLEDAETIAKIQFAKNHIRVILPELQFTSKLIDGKFPEYSGVIPKVVDKKVTLDRHSFRQALQRTSILSNEKYRGIRLHLEGDRLTVSAHNPEQEEAEEELGVDYQGASLDIGFNVTYLLDVLSVLPTDSLQIKLSDANSSCLIEDSGETNCRYVIMPMRL